VSGKKSNVQDNDVGIEHVSLSGSLQPGHVTTIMFAYILD